MACQDFNPSQTNAGIRAVPLADLFAHGIAKRVQSGAVTAAEAEQALAIVGFSAAGAWDVLEGSSR